MEKLQEALAKARAQRDGAPVSRSVRPELSARRKSRQQAKEEVLNERWMAVQPFEPAERKLKQARIVASDPTAEATHFDILRTKLLLEARRNDWNRIAITSAAAASGKTTTACNLITGFGRQPEVRGILLDFDLRRPSVAKFFGAEPAASVADVLDGSVPFSEQALRLHPNTLVSVAKKPVHDPSRLVQRQSAIDIIDDIQAAYQPDIMLFDLPPVLVSDEARALLKLVDAVLIVAAADMTSLAQIDECEREVSEYTNVAGVVLNKCRYLEEGYGYSY